jgi:hypothetical protein
MKAKREITRRMMTAVAAGLMLAATSQADAKPLKVFILAGQSNMEGHGKISTFEQIGMDPATEPMLAEMLNADGSPKVCERVWISSIGCAEAEQTRRTISLAKAWAGHDQHAPPP